MASRHLMLSNIFNQMGREARLMAQAWLILTLTNSDAWVGTDRLTRHCCRGHGTDERRAG